MRQPADAVVDTSTLGMRPSPTLGPTGLSGCKPGRQSGQTGHAQPRGLVALAAVTLAFALLAGALTWGPNLARARLAQHLSHLLGTPVTIGRIEVALWGATVQVHDLTLASADPARPSVQLDTLSVGLAPWASLRHGAVILKRLELRRPRVRIVRTGPRTLDLTALFERLAARPSTGPSPAWRIDALRITEGSLIWDDRVVAHTTRLDGLALTLHALSTLPTQTEQPARLDATAHLNDQPLRVQGEATPFAQAPSVQLQGSLAALPLSDLLPYLPMPATMPITDGTLALSFQANWRSATTPEQDPELTLAGTLELDDGRIADRSGRARLSWARASLTLEPSPLLPAPRLHLAQIKVEAPTLVLQRGPDGRLDWPSAPQSVGTPPAPPIGGGSLRIDHIELRRGTLDWRDATLTPRLQTRLASMDLQADQLWVADLGHVVSALSGTARVAAKLDDTSPLALDLVLQRGSAEARIAAQQLDLRRWAFLAGPALRARIERGQLSARAVLRGDLNTADWSVSDGAADLNDLSVHDAQGPALTLQSVQVRGGAMDSAARRVNVGRLHIDGGRLALQRDASGQFNFMHWYEPAPRTAADPAPAWSTTLGEVQATGLVLQYHDDQLPAESQWPSMRLTARAGPIEPATGRPIALQGRLQHDDGSLIKWVATVPVGPGTLDAALSVQGVALHPLSPYLAPYVNLSLSTGQLWGTGRLTLRKAPDGALERIAFKGGVSLSGFSAVDPRNDDLLLRGSGLAAPEIDVAWSLTNPADRHITLGDLALVDFDSRIIISPEGRSNLSELLSSPTTQAPTDPAPASTAVRPADPAPAVQVGTVRMAGGAIDFTDHFIRPSFRAQLSQLAGAIEAIRPDPGTPADVLITGYVDGDTPLEITGSVQPFGRPAQMDLRAIAKGFDLPKISAYSGRWAGYAIEKGKLSADVRYTLHGDELSAQNRLTLNQLTFGEKVESPDALNLPLRLAVALLKDPQGNIDLDLPISGTLTDPQFSVGSLLWQALRNLLLKAVTAPFSLLASLAGDTEHNALNAIEFQPGASDLDATARQRLDGLAQALAARPGLSLEIVGHADPESDRQALENAQRAAMPRGRSLTKRQREGPAVADEALKTLAQQRANHTRDYLRTAHGLSTERLWLLAPRLSHPDPALPARRAEFTLQ